jgi:hypothetical protein
MRPGSQSATSGTNKLLSVGIVLALLVFLDIQTEGVSFASEDCFNQKYLGMNYAPCKPSTNAPILPGMVLPMKKGEEMVPGNYQVSPVDAQCIAELSALGLTALYTKNAAAVLAEGSAMEVTTRLAEACGETVVSFIALPEGG